MFVILSNPIDQTEQKLTFVTACMVLQYTPAGKRVPRSTDWVNLLASSDGVRLYFLKKSNEVWVR